MKKIFVMLVAASASLFAQELSSEQTSSLLARLAEAREGAALTADFRDEKHLALMPKPVIETGTVAFLPPDKFRREVKDKSLTICDGTTLWLYYPAYQEVEKYRLSANRSLRESLSAMNSGFGLQNLDANYAVEARQVPEGHQLTLTPKNSSLRKTVTRITLLISEALAVTRMEILGAQGDRTVTAFSNERKQTLSPAHFQFEVPPGAHVSEPLK